MGVGILIPMNSPIGMIFGVIAIVIVGIFVMAVLGSGVAKVVDKSVTFVTEKDHYYHKQNKNHGIAFLCSLLLPFSGNLYLKESIISLLCTCFSIMIILYNIIGVFTITDFHYFNFYMPNLLILLWLISLISLVILIVQYNKYKESYPPSKKTDLPFLEGKKFLIIIPIILFILLIGTIIMVPNDITSEKLYDADTYTLECPQNYALIKDNEDISENNEYHVISMFGDKDDGDNYMFIEVFDYDSSAKEAANIRSHVELNYGVRELKDGGTTNVDGSKAYIVIDEIQDWTDVIFKKDGKLYQIEFKRGAQEKEIMDSFLNSFKFK